MTIYPNLGLTIPTRGSAGVGHWADVLDADIALIDAHDHTTGKGLAIRTGAITIDSDLSFSSLWAVSAMHRVSFSSVTPLTTNNKSLFVSSADNELYFRSNTGSNIKLTDGTSINVAGFLGSIGGDYVSVGALADYDSATHSYRMRQEIGSSVRQYARTKTGSIDLLEFKAAGTTPSVTVFVRLSSPAALVNTYEVTFPDALPASTSLVQMSSTGVLTVSNTLPALAHGALTLALTGTDFVVQSGTATFTTTGSITTTAAAVLIANLPLRVGDRITNVSATFDSGTGTVDVTDFHVSKISSDGTDTSLGVTTASNIAAPTITPLNVTDTTLAANESFIMSISINATGCTVRNISVTYTRP